MSLYSQSILIYLKPTNFCNVGCTHCYLPEDLRANKLLMDKETFMKSIEFINEMASIQGSMSAIICWHGGEPLSVSPSYYFEMSDLLRKHMKVDFIEGVQTSLIPFTERWLPLFKERWGSMAGASIDFHTRQIRGSNEEYRKLFIDKVNLARDNGIFISPNMVVSKNEMGRAGWLLDWYKENRFKTFRLERYNKFGIDVDDWPTNMEHSLFLMELFDESMKRLEETGTVVTNNVLDAAFKGILYNQPGDRWGGTCQSDFLVIDPDGKTNNCPDKISFEKDYSNVSNGFRKFASSKSRVGWVKHQHITHKKDHCMVCENRTWCKSGCPITPNGPSDGQEECAGYKTFLNHVRDYINKNGESAILKYIELEENSVEVEDYALRTAT